MDRERVGQALASRQLLCKLARQGDLIVAFNSQPIGTVHHLHKILVGEQINVSASLTIIRHTEKLDVRILPAESRPAK